VLLGPERQGCKPRPPASPCYPTAAVKHTQTKQTDRPITHRVLQAAIGMHWAAIKPGGQPVAHDHKPTVPILMTLANARTHGIQATAVAWVGHQGNARVAGWGKHGRPLFY
jgi:hypothetical protein